MSSGVGNRIESSVMVQSHYDGDECLGFASFSEGKASPVCWLVFSDVRWESVRGHILITECHQVLLPQKPGAHGNDGIRAAQRRFVVIPEKLSRNNTDVGALVT